MKNILFKVFIFDNFLNIDILQILKNIENIDIISNIDMKMIYQNNIDISKF